MSLLGRFGALRRFARRWDFPLACLFVFVPFSFDSSCFPLFSSALLRVTGAALGYSLSPLGFGGSGVSAPSRGGRGAAGDRDLQGQVQAIDRNEEIRMLSFLAKSDTATAKAKRYVDIVASWAPLRRLYNSICFPRDARWSMVAAEPHYMQIEVPCELLDVMTMLLSIQLGALQEDIKVSLSLNAYTLVLAFHHFNRAQFTWCSFCRY